MYRTTVEHDSELEEYFIILPQELMDEMGIKMGDELTWVVEGDEIRLRKNSS
jgi:bifunctional DNA-binding transcriptional regulator/antitoxin component of YhaV-PrlF toxin-antitoxin module